MNLFYINIAFMVSASLYVQKTTDEMIKIMPCTDFELDGEGNHEQWSEMEWHDIKQRGFEGKTYETKFKVSYSESGMYFLFYCQDDEITSTLREDFADLWEEDVVEIFLWTNEDSPIYFEYELSPYNFELPILIPNYDGEFLGWRPWHYEGSRKTRHETKILKKDGRIYAWTAEIFIPFELLKPLQNVPPVKGMEWKMNVYRNDYDNGFSSWSWKPIVTNYHDYKRFGTIHFE